MIIQELHLENFLIMSKADVNLDNKGLILIVGENKDDTSANSNGSGKSTIVDALLCFNSPTSITKSTSHPS